MKVGFISLGCCKNLVDSEYIIGMFDEKRFEFSSDPKECDVIIINTCGFILSAKKEAIDTILEMAEYKKGRLKKLIVTGCLAQRYYEDLKKDLPEVDAFIKIDDYDDLNDILKELLGEEFTVPYRTNRKLITNNYYGYLKIAEGCDNCCAYCAIPLIRGNCRSFAIEDLYKEAMRLYELGVKELNVIAQDTTYYGYDLYGHFALKDLLKRLDEIPFKWIRVLYMYPDEIEDDLLEFMTKAKRVIPYFDIPIQYGNDKILKLMNRRGSVALIKEKIAKIRELFKEPVLRTTLIVGFPFEDEETFKDTLELVKELRFDSLGAFTYSKEEDTKAYEYDHEVDEKTALRRYEELMDVQKKIVSKKAETKVSKVYEVLCERYEELFDRYVGRSIYSAPDDVDGVVYFKSDKVIKPGDFVNVEITGYEDYDLYGVAKE